MLALAALLLPGCRSDHHVSPWGSLDRPRLGDFVERPDLASQVARIDAETAPLGLRLVTEIAVDLPRRGGRALIRGYEGEDALGRRTHAVRVATGHGVVMALGPLDMRDPIRAQATELVPALVSGEGGRAFRSGTDLNGDGALDVVVRNDAGALEIWRVSALGANRYEVAMEAPPTRALDVDGDGFIDLTGEVAIEAGDPLAPRLTDVATFDGARYTNATPAARAFHARLSAPAPPAPPGQAAPPPRDEVRLRGALERAWHAVLSGQPREETLKELSREAAPAALRAAFERHVRRIAALPERRVARARPGKGDRPE